MRFEALQRAIERGYVDMGRATAGSRPRLPSNEPGDPGPSLSAYQRASGSGRS